MSERRSKAELRRDMRLLLANHSEDEQREASRQAAERLQRQDIWREARAILFYAPIRGELDLLPMMDSALKLKKTVLLPRFVASSGTYEAVRVSHFQNDCSPGKFGIAEPGLHCPAFPLNCLDLALVPGLGFDEAGHRLGRGRGFYDRLLAEIDAIKCGVAFDRQIVGEIPAEGHDIHMNFILTPTRWMQISK